MGPFVIFLGCALLWFNEGVAIKTHRSLNEAQDAFVRLPSATDVNYDNDGKLVHVSHRVSVDSPATDPDFGLSRESVSLQRNVETYQWVEHHSTKERKLQNGETEVKDIYTYTKEWRSGGMANSNSFKHPEGHYNENAAASYSSQHFSAGGVRLGTFALGSALLSQLTHSSPVPLDRVSVPSGGEISGGHIYFQGSGNRGGGGDDRRRSNYQNRDARRRTSDDYDNSAQDHGRADIEKKIMSIDGEDKIMYVVKRTGETFSSMRSAEESLHRSGHGRRLLSVGSPGVGDVRVSFTEVACRTVSVLAAQRGSELAPWKSSQGEGYNVGILVSGSQSPEEMLNNAQSANDIWTWVKRAVGWLLTFIGFKMMTSIISVSADITLNWIPFLGPMATSIIDLGVFIADLVLSVSLSFLVAAVAWVFYRPVLGCTMLAGALGLLYLSSKAGEQKKAAGKMGKA